MSAAVIASLVVSLLGVGIALYAATLSRRALAWQQRRDAERRSTRVRVEFDHAAEQVPIFAISLPDTDPRPQPVYYRLSIVVVNDGESAEYVTRLDVHQAEGDRGYDLSGQLDGAHHEVKPRGRLAVEFSATECGFDLSEGFVGIVELASGQVVRSDVEHLHEELLQHVAEHNLHARR